MLAPGYFPQAGFPVAQPAPAYVTLPPAVPRAQVAVAAPAPKVRMQAPDEPRAATRVATAIPSPEQLGLTRSQVSSVDWDGTRGKLRQLGATSFQLDRVPAGGFRFTCWLPAEQTGKSYRIEAEGGGEAEAVRLCLERTERWLSRSR
jgi:hypothetical protein